MIKANVNYTGEHMWASHKMYSRFDWKFFTEILFLSASIVVCIGFILYLLPFFGKADWVTKSILIFLIGLAINIFFIISAVLKKIKKKKEVKANLPGCCDNNLSFDDKEFFHEYKSDDEWGFRRCGYDMLHSAAESKQFFFIRLNESSVCIIGKHEITQGTSEELSLLLAEKFGKKFRRKCR